MTLQKQKNTLIRSTKVIKNSCQAEKTFLNKKINLMHIQHHIYKTIRKLRNKTSDLRPSKRAIGSKFPNKLELVLISSYQKNQIDFESRQSEDSLFQKIDESKKLKYLKMFEQLIEKQPKQKHQLNRIAVQIANFTLVQFIKQQRKIENDCDESQQHQENELNRLIQILYGKHQQIIEYDQSVEIQKEPKKDEQKVELLQNSTNIQQIYIASKSSDYEDDYDSNQNLFPQFEQKGIQRFQSIIENLSSLQQNQKNKLINVQKNLKPECEQFLREMFQLGDHINSGGEADIFLHANDECIVYRVIQVKNDEDLDEQLLELQILFCDPFTEWKMATMAFIPKKYAPNQTYNQFTEVNSAQFNIDLFLNAVPAQNITLFTLDIRKNLIGLEGASILLQFIENIKQLEIVNINLARILIGDEQCEILNKTITNPNKFKTFNITFSRSDHTSQNLDQNALIPIKKIEYVKSFEKFRQFPDNPQINTNIEVNQINLNLNFGDNSHESQCFNNLEEINKQIYQQSLSLMQNNQAQKKYSIQENEQNLNPQVEQLDLLLDCTIALDDQADSNSQKKQQSNIRINLHQCGKYISFEGAQKLISRLLNCQNVSILNLNLSKSSINGQVAKIISQGLKHMQDITELNLNLNNNNIQDEGAQSIIDTFINCLNITQFSLKLMKNKIGADGIDCIADILNLCKNINQLNINLGGNSISDYGIQIIAKSLEKFENVSYLQLDLIDNKIDDQGFSDLTCILFKCKNISSLNLNLNCNNIVNPSLNDSNLLEQCLSIIDLTLELKENKIRMNVAINIANILKKCQNLTKLKISLKSCWNDHFGDNEIEVIANSLQDSQSLTELNLNLSFNKINAEGILYLTETLNRCQKINQLNLNLLHFSDDKMINFNGLNIFADTLKNSENISELNLSSGYTQIGKDGNNILVTTLENIQNIKSLELYLEKLRNKPSDLRPSKRAINSKSLSKLGLVLISSYQMNQMYFESRQDEDSLLQKIYESKQLKYLKMFEQSLENQHKQQQQLNGSAVQIANFTVLQFSKCLPSILQLANLSQDKNVISSKQNNYFSLNLYKQMQQIGCRKIIQSKKSKIDCYKLCLNGNTFIVKQKCPLAIYNYDLNINPKIESYQSIILQKMIVISYIAYHIFKQYKFKKIISSNFDQSFYQYIHKLDQICEMHRNNQRFKKINPNLYESRLFANSMIKEICMKSKLSTYARIQKQFQTMAVLLNSKKNSKQNLLYNNKILKEQKNKETFSFNLKNLNFNETLSQLKLSKLKNTLLFGKKIKLKKLQQNENAKTNKKKLQLLGGSDNNYQKIINSQLKYEEQDSSILEQTIKKKQQDKQQVQLHTKQQIEQRKIENDNDETQQHQENELNMLIQILYDKHLEIIERDQSIEIQKEPKKDVQKVELLQNSTNIQQIYIASKSSDYEDDYDSNQNQFPQFEQKGIQRLQTIKENLSSLQQNQKNKLINAQKNLKPECEQFLREMFQLGDHINSGGEADIFIHENDESIAYRVIQVKNDEDLDEQLLELQSIKVLNEQNILDLNVSHMLEDRINNNMYLIHVMQKCETSLQDEIIAKKPFSLDETLSFISTGFHLLIALRQKYIYHSDIKPGNILKVGDCNYKLSDFGASQKILFCDPFTEWKMATMAFIPKKQTLDLPFYHDIYSFGKTIEMVLQLLENHQEIKQSLQQLINEDLCRDDENSIKINCFELPRMLINILIKLNCNQEIDQFLLKYLIQIEQYLTINKEDKVFEYESYQLGLCGAQEVAYILQKLQNITELNLCFYQSFKTNQGNELTQHIVDILENCQYLTDLDLELSKTFINDEGAINIANALMLGQNIVKLNIDLSNNNIQDEGAQSIIDTFINCLNITEFSLKLMENNIKSEGAKIIAKALETCDKITKLNLNLENNEIDDKGFSDLTSILLKYKNISSLNLNLKNDNFGDDEIEVIANSLLDCQNLTELNLNLYANNITSSGVKHIAVALRKCRDLKILNLNLQQNQISTEGMFFIAETLKICQKINQLNLSIGYFSDDDVIDYNGINIFADTLQNSENITELNLSYVTYISSSQAKSVYKILEKCQNLTQLTLKFMQNLILKDFQRKIQQILFTNKQCFQILIFYKQNRQYQILEEEINIEYDGILNFADSLQKLQKLTRLELDLSFNRIGVEAIQNIANVLKKCQKITNLALKLSNNNIEGDGNNILVTTLEKNQNIKSLELYLESAFDYQLVNYK
ncbi:hypothetical protein ABPG73_008975 [Tetrahymena malaccensis]